MLHQFKITGEDSDTGEVIEITVRADSIEEAAAKAAQRNISVELIALEKKSPSSPHPAVPLLPQGSLTAETAQEHPHKLYRKESHRWWLLIVGSVIFLTAPVFPIISLLFGLAILFLCFGVFIPQVKHLSYRLLKIDHEQRWRKRLRLATYGAIGFVFVFFAFVGFEVKAEEQETAAMQEAARVESQRLTEGANSGVASLAREAEEIWNSGNKAMAIEKLDEAEKTLYASNFAPVRYLRTKMANADVSAIVTEAISAAEAGELGLASDKLESAIAIPNATDLEAAKNLMRYIGLVEESGRVKKAMLKLSDAELASLENQGVIPDSFISGYAGLDKHLAESVKKEVGAVLAEKEKLRQAEEQKRLLQAEAETFVKSGVGKKVPFDKWKLFGSPKTMDGTDNRYWVAYLDGVNVSFVSEKSSDLVIFAAFGEREATDFLAEKDKNRTKQLEAQFSAWDGSHDGVTKAIKASMNDPDSYKHVETVYWDMDDHLVVQTTFRGKNAFGGVVSNRLKAKVDLNGAVLEIIEQGP